MKMEIYRGDMFYVNRFNSVESEQQSGRPAIVVSNEKCNEHSDVIEVVYLTTQPKTYLPTHVTIRSSRIESTALCEQVHSVAVSRLGDYIGSITDDEQSRIDMALLISLDLYMPQPPEMIVEEMTAELNSGEPIENDPRFVRVEAERDIYKHMYTDLLELMLNGHQYSNSGRNLQ